MSLEGLINIKKAISTLNSNTVRELADKRVLVGLHASTDESFARMQNFLLADLSPARRLASAASLVRSPGNILGQPAADINVFDEGMQVPPHGLIFHPNRPQVMVAKALSNYPDLSMPLAKTFLPFRAPFVEKSIANTARENTLFSLATALPDIVPSIIELPWALAEFASDTAFLTMNQIRMAFLIAGASDREVGYMEQKTEIAAVVGSAFGWRALARQVVGKIPFGGGLIGKAAIAYAGTKVLGLSLDKFYGVGYTYPRDERDALYADAYRQGRTIALKILGLLRPDLAQRFSLNADSHPRTGHTRTASQGTR